MSQTAHRTVFCFLVLSLLAGLFFYVQTGGVLDKMLSATVTEKTGLRVGFQDVRLKSWQTLEFRKAFVVGPEGESWADTGKGEIALRFDGMRVAGGDARVSDLRIEAPLSARMNFKDKIGADLAEFSMRQSGKNTDMALALYGPNGLLFRASWQMAGKG